MKIAIQLKKYEFLDIATFLKCIKFVFMKSVQNCDKKSGFHPKLTELFNIVKEFSDDFFQTENDKNELI